MRRVAQRRRAHPGIRRLTARVPPLQAIAEKGHHHRGRRGPPNDQAPPGRMVVARSCAPQGFGPSASRRSSSWRRTTRWPTSPLHQTSAGSTGTEGGPPSSTVRRVHRGHPTRCARPERPGWGANRSLMTRTGPPSSALDERMMRSVAGGDSRRGRACRPLRALQMEVTSSLTSSARLRRSTR